MATERLRVILEMVTGQYQAGAKAAATETGKLSGAVQRAGSAAGNLKTAFVGVASVLGSAKVLKDLAEMAAEDAKQQDILAQSLRNNTGATDAQVDANEEWITSFSKTVGIADDKLRPAFGLLAIAGRTVEQSQKDMAVAADIAVARNLDLQTVAVAMSKAAQGQTTALRRLGIQTTDTAGAALSYDDILKNAAATMGGAAAKGAQSLGGQLERQQIQWEETKENIGAKVLPQLNKLGEAFQFLTAGFDAGAQASALVTNTLNQMSREGIDPASDKTATLVLAMRDMSDRQLMSGQALQDMSVSLQLTGEEAETARSRIIRFGESAGLSADQVNIIADQLEAYIRHQKAANDQTKGGTKSHEEYVEAIHNSRTALAEMADPALAWFNSAQRLTESQLAYSEAVKEFGPASDEAVDAFGNLVKAQGDADDSQAKLAEEGTQAAIKALEDMGIRAGLTRDEVNLLIAAMGGVVGAAATWRDLPPIVIRTRLSGRPGSGDAVRAHGGPVTAGQSYTVGERGAETFVPNTSGRIIPNGGNMTQSSNVSMVFQRVDGDHVDRDIQRGVILSGLSRLVETR